jgi:hypothetical protein
MKVNWGTVTAVILLVIAVVVFVYVLWQLPS